MHKLPWLLFFLVGCQTSKVKQVGYFELEGQIYQMEHLSPQGAQKIYSIEKDSYEKKREILRNEVYQIYKTKIDPTYTEPKYEVSEREIQAAYERNQGVLPYSYEFAKKELEELIREDKKEQHISQIIRALEKEKGLRLLSLAQEPPARSKVEFHTQGFPSKGSGRNVLVKFGDFTCPYCKQAARDLARMKSVLTSEYTLVYKFYSTHPSEYVRHLEKLAMCSHQQNKFWEFHDYIFIEHKDFIPPSQEAIQSKIQLNEEKLENCLKDPTILSTIDKSYEEAKRLGVNKTPFFFLNGRPFQGALNQENLKSNL